MLSYPWPGNARELFNTLYRAAIWSTEDTILVDDIREILIHAATPTENLEGPLSLGNGVNLPELLANIARQHLMRALEVTGGNKTKAAKLLGLPNYQTFSNWCEKYGVRI
jgi:DNA-binding NtrC family response regulator